MKDATDVSLETDRLEQLLEAPVPAPPVVMIQYRARGIPWWVFVPLLFVVPIVTILVYHQSVIERYRAQAAEATHFVETWEKTARNTKQPATDLTAGSPQVLPAAAAAAEPKPTVTAPGEPASSPLAAVATAKTVSASDSGAGSTSGGTVPAPAGAGPGSIAAAVGSGPPPASAAGAGSAPGAAPASQKSEPSPKTDSDGIARNDLPTGPSGGSATVGEQPPRPRVRSVFPSAFEPETPPAASTGKPVDPVGPGRVASVPVAPAPEPEPLPSKEEMERQIADEADRKERDMAEERAGRIAGIRAMRYEDRVKFHKELRDLLEIHGKDAGKEIDKLVSRSSHDYNMQTYAKARSIWRHVRMTQRAKVDAIRLLDIPEPAILNFMSDNLFGRIRAPGGPRNENEVRIRASQLLLSYQLPAAPVASTSPDAAPAAGPRPARTVTPSQPGGRRPQ